MNMLDEIQCEDYYGDEPPLELLAGPDDDTVLDDDDEDMLDTQEMDALTEDDEDDHFCVVGADDDLFNEHGVTAAGYALLAEMDRQGQFV